MKIVAVDPFYLKMPDITTDADGTQDTLAVRVRTDEGIRMGRMRCLTAGFARNLLLPDVTWKHHQYSSITPRGSPWRI